MFRISGCSSRRLFFSTIATAIVIENYNPKLNGVQGVITKIEGNKLTIKNDAGKLITLGVRAESADDKHKIKLFKIGDKVRIQDGKLFLLSELQKQPLQPAGGAAAMTLTNQPPQPAGGAAAVTFTNQPLQPAGGRGVYTTTTGSPAQGK